MFDGVGTLSFLSQDLAKIPLSVPVYNIAADPSRWNWYGDTNRKLDLVRPGMFTGVTIKGGHHADGMQTTAPIVQYFAYLAMGHSSPVDVMANKVLAAGWINDMLEGTRTAGLYNDNASTWDIVTGWWWGQMTKRRPGARTRSPSDRRSREISADLCHQTPRYLLTDGRKRANLLASMFARDEDASQRPRLRRMWSVAGC